MRSAAHLSTIKPEAAARLLELIQMPLISEAIHVVAALGVADLLADSPKSVEQLAEATEASPASLTTMSNDLWAALVDEPMAQLHGCRADLEVTRFSITPGHMGTRRCLFGQDAEPSPRRGWPVPVLYVAEHVAKGHEADRAAVARIAPVVAQHETHPVRHLRLGVVR